MTAKGKPRKLAAQLLRKAEAPARDKAPATEDLASQSPEEIKKMLHEMHVHQVQLEMQNEELRQVQGELDAARARYADLYEQAPVGYLTLADTGLIVEANITAATLLGAPRELVCSLPFSRFLLDEDQGVYDLGQEKSAGNREPTVCELRMLRRDGTIFWARLLITSLLQVDGRPMYRVVLCDITDHKRAEETLLEQHALLEAFFEISPDILGIQHPDHTIERYNAAGYKLLGMTYDEVKGKKCYELIGRTHECEECATRMTLKTKKPEQLEKYIPEMDLYMDCRSYPILDGNREILYIVEQLRDISERKRAEAALRESERQRREEQKFANTQLQEHSDSLISIYQALDSVGLIVCDLVEDDARIKIFNTGAEKLFGYRDEEAIGKSIALIYPPELVGLISNRVKQFKNGKAMQSFDMTLVRQSGERFPAVVSIHPFDRRKGRCRKVVGIFRDISQLMQVQQQLEAMNEELERRVEERTRELQETQKQYLHAEKLSAIGKLSASIAHEFNNPLQGILFILKGLKKRAILEEEDKALLEAAIGEGDRIKELIRGLQDFNRPSSGQKMLVDVHKALDSMLLLHKSDFKAKRVAVECNYAAWLPQILAVPDQIKQVFLNLLTNAADACRRVGGVITISTWQEKDRVAIAIKDTGIGIKPEEMDLIFQPFYTTKPEVKGTGLGLSISHGIVEGHGGEIRVESWPGEGATFTVLLPIDSAAAVSTINR